LKNGWTRSLNFNLSEASQVPGYTAIGSNPSGGLFRGNPDLGREYSQNIELSIEVADRDWSVGGTLFHRADQDLVDWVFNSGATPFASRFARNVDISTTGVEWYGAMRKDRWEARVSYAFLSKDEDYGSPDVDGSFYALNFPEHRATLGLIWRVVDALTLRLDQEWREQKANPLRDGRNSGWFGQVGLTWIPREEWPVDITARVVNLWDIEFEEVPGVPGARRTGSVMVRYFFP
jgi:outer membrane receptor for ferrienterochelin and colicin